MADEIEELIKVVVVASVIPTLTQNLNPSPLNQVFDMMFKSVALATAMAPLQYFMNIQRLEAKINYILQLITGQPIY